MPQTTLFDSTRRQFLLQAAAAGIAAGQGQGPSASRSWTAKWIAVPDAPPTDYGVYHFRHGFDLAAKPRRFVVHVTADQRYQLFVNGRRVSMGPARGTQLHWRYQTVDLAPHLQAGRNVLAAVVWNFGRQAPEAQMTFRTGFLMDGDTAAERVVATGPEWKCARAQSYTALSFTSGQMRGYYVAGPGDRVDGSKHDWGWESRDFDDSAWPAATVVADPSAPEASEARGKWVLVPSLIPPEEESPQRLQAVRRVEGISKPAAFPSRPEPLAIPAQTHAVLLLDQTFLTTAYPELTISGGKDSVLKLRYAETLSRPDGRSYDKGNRNEIEGKEFVGYNDEFISDGGARRLYRPLWWRTYRYLELDVQTRSEPLTIDDLAATYIGYPFERKAQFDAGTPEIRKILDIGWRTARLCAHETFMDCPYYEQLQYIGDTRIQCLVSLYNSGDGRLMRNAIDHINDSRRPDGLTQSRYPTRGNQYIPSFSLWWIGMAHDYWRYVDDPEFIRGTLPGIRDVLRFFQNLQKENGSLGQLPPWRYMDWAPEWQNGDAPSEADGSSGPHDFLLAMAFQWAAELETALGSTANAEAYRKRRAQLFQTIPSLYWDAEKRLYADTPKRALFSQHTNILAVLSGLVEGAAARELMLRILGAPGLAQVSMYFRYYLNCALAKVGEGDGYIEKLGDWRKMMALGLTTFSETLDRPGAPSRSDCHAWSASPNIEILRTVLGVDSAAPGFGRVSIRPHLGKLPFATGSVPHPKGAVTVSLQPKGSQWAVAIQLPAGVTGEFEWHGTKREIQPGPNRFTAG